MVLLIFQCFDGKKCAKRENTALSKTRYHMTKLLPIAASSLIPTLSMINKRVGSIGLHARNQ